MILKMEWYIPNWYLINMKHSEPKTLRFGLSNVPNRIGEIRGTIDLPSEQRYANPFGIVYAMTCISCILYHSDASSM